MAGHDVFKQVACWVRKTPQKTRDCHCWPPPENASGLVVIQILQLQYTLGF